jgi:hypothetical protein
MSLRTLKDVEEAAHSARNLQSLIVRAVEITGERGITLVRLQRVFSDTGIGILREHTVELREAGAIQERWEDRPNRGRLVQQAVFYRATVPLPPIRPGVVV